MLGEITVSLVYFKHLLFMIVSLHQFVTIFVSQESLSPDISTPTATPTPTPTPGSPVVDGTPRTASQWLKKVQPKSPNKNEDDKCPEANTVMMSPCHSTAKKRKFVR